MVYIDETHWEMYEIIMLSCNMTAIMTITRDGPLYTLMVQKDSVKAADFVSYFTLQVY